MSAPPMSAWETFSWRGEPIMDIETWAKERGEQIVAYTRYRKIVLFGSYGAKFATETETGEMPESFWNCLHWGEWRYTETGRRTP